jgi:hypothetical protein
MPRHKKDDDEVPANILRAMPTPRKPPVRTTVPVPTNIRPEMIERAKADADRTGFRSLRAYLEALIAQGLVAEEDAEANPPDEQTLTLAAAYPSSAWALGPTILMHRTVSALEALADRTRAGEDVDALRADLVSLRWEIGQHLLALRGDYDHEVAARDARHYARFGRIDE